MSKRTIAIASGKGGTGKTTFAINLAYSVNESVALLDCDVEAPNTHLFFQPVINDSTVVNVLYPEIETEKCIGCGKCKEHCRFGAIILLKEQPLVSKELCHSCGACVLACPLDLIVERQRPIGFITNAHVNLPLNSIHLIQGMLNIGEARSSALIDEIRKMEIQEKLHIIDAPPGTSCATIAAVNRADYLVLVTEPTPFGLNDLKLAVEMAEKLDLKTGVIINKADIGEAPIKNYLKEKQIKVLGEINFDPLLAKTYSEGRVIVKELPQYKPIFEEIFARIDEEMSR